MCDEQGDEKYLLYYFPNSKTPFSHTFINLELISNNSPLSFLDQKMS